MEKQEEPLDVMHLAVLQRFWQEVDTVSMHLKGFFLFLLATSNKDPKVENISRASNLSRTRNILNVPTVQSTYFLKYTEHETLFITLAAVNRAAVNYVHDSPN